MRSHLLPQNGAGRCTRTVLSRSRLRL